MITYKVSSLASLWIRNNSCPSWINFLFFIYEFLYNIVVKHTNLEVINFIISQWQPYKNDKELVSLLVDYFDQDVVVLGIVDLLALAEGVTDVYFEQYISGGIDEDVAFDLKKISYTGAFKESFEGEKADYHKRL